MGWRNGSSAFGVQERDLSAGDRRSSSGQTIQLKPDQGGCAISTGDGTSFRDAVYECTMDVTDARRQGVTETINSCDCSEDGETTFGECHGTSLVTNDGGTWEGTFTGTTTWSTAEPDHLHHMDLVFIGTGDYDGLRFVAEMDGYGYPWDVTGHIESTG
jgi:hypothetical protein